MNNNYQKEITKDYEFASMKYSKKTGMELPKFPEKLRQGESVMNEKLGIEHAYGQVYYPCGGEDSETIVDLFKNYSKEILFSTAKSGSESIPDIGNFSTIRSNLKPKIFHGYKDYRQDAILTFLTEIDELAVLFHRQDSTGEGGSNQWWKGPVLLPLVLTKLLDGGLIVTDKCLCGDPFGYKNEVLPWNKFCNFNNKDKPEIGDKFNWINFGFECVAGPFYRFQKTEPRTYVWQVTNIE